MSRREKDAVDSQSPGGFISRWSRLKQAAASPPQAVTEPPETSLPEELPERPLTDADMPPLESLDETSDYTGFLSEKVSETLRRQALRKLFHSAAFNVCDGLDDYDGNYTSFAGLGEIVTVDMRHQLAMAEAKLKAASGAGPQRTPQGTPQPTPQPSEEPEQAAVVAPVTVDAGVRPAAGDAEDPMPEASRQPDSGSDDGTTS